MNSAYETLIRSYILQNAAKTMKPADDLFPYPFVDPGSVYDGNLWDWDSFWAVYALLCLCKGNGDSFRNKVLEHAQGNVRNFFAFQLSDGYIPMMIEKNADDPEPYLIKKHRQGALLNMCKPFLCQQIALISGFTGDFEWVREFLKKIELYFESYNKYYYNANCGLYVWADDVMIGVDNDPASFGRPRFSTANIYLNSFLVMELRAGGKIARNLGNADLAEMLEKRAETLISHIQAECWDKRDKIFYSVDTDIHTRAYDWFHKGLGVFWKTLPIKIRVWSCFLPMLAGFATKEQAAELVRHLTDPKTFASPNGIVSLSMDEKMYNLEPSNNPSNWLGPIWLVVQYILFRSLKNYGYHEEAERLCNQTIDLLGRDLEKTGTMHEFYHPQTGEPILNGGFLNWNMLAINMIDESNGAAPMLDFIL